MNKTKKILAVLVMCLPGLFLTACGDSASQPTTTLTGTAITTSTVTNSTALAAVPTTRSELSPNALPTFTPATTNAAGLVPTATSVEAGSDSATTLTNPATQCGKIPYYVSPKLDANGKPIGSVYTAIGASDTVGTGSNMPRTDSWVVQLYDKMPKDFQFVRLGIGGLTLHEASQCFLTKAIASNPTVISDWNVVNDVVRGVTLTDYKTDLEYFLQQLTSQTQAKILVGNAPDLNSLPFVKRITGSRADLTKVTKDWNDLIAQEVAKYPGRVYLVDLQAGMGTFSQHPEWLSGDGLHPTTQGYVQLAGAFWDVIKANKLIH